MILDVSSNQGKIDWAKVSKQDVTRVILRSTTKNGKLDTRTLENYNGILQNMNGKLQTVDFYKFSYIRTYSAARFEALQALWLLEHSGIRLEVMDYFFLDLEAWGGRDYTSEEAGNVILGYKDTCDIMGVKMGIYANYNYVRNIIPREFSNFPLWIARYNSTLGNVMPWHPMFWQYTSTGHVDGIQGNVDISKEIGHDKDNN